jgi:hypothetical protein
LDGQLEGDICELAVVAGATAGNHDPDDTLLAYAADLGTDGLPTTETLLGEDVAASLSGHLGGTEAAADH